MAFRNLTYESLLGRMMDRVHEQYPNLDTREGSILFNALAPAALELSVAYTYLDLVLSESFVDTATREYILLACEQMGMNTSDFEAKASVHKGLFDTQVSVGSRWNCELYNYVVTSYSGVDEDGYHIYQLECETLGSAPNKHTGDLIAITEIPLGLSYAALVECLIEGEDETTDEDIRSAYYNFVNSTRSDGNVDQYKQWCNEYKGIGNYKIFPLWNGANTVKVSILSSSNGVASEELVAEFQEYLDPNSEGMGNGVAPIGSIVTVSTAEEMPVEVTATVKMKSGYTDTQPITDAVAAYLSSIAYEKDYIPYMNIGAVILAVEGVESIRDLVLTGGNCDIPVQDEQVPVLGYAEWTVE